MSSLQVGLSLSFARLRGLSTALVLTFACGVLYALAVLERRADAASAADYSLTGGVFGLAVPLLSYLLVERVCAGGRLQRSVDGVARYGANRRTALAGMLLGSAVCMGLVSALLTFSALLGAQPLSHAALTAELRVSLGIALFAGAAYVLFFAAASLFGARGGGRRWALIVDFVLGASASGLAVPWPRAHLRNLLGGQPPLGWSQSSAWLALALIALVSATLSLSRTSK